MTGTVRVGGKGTGLAKRTFVAEGSVWVIQTPDGAVQAPEKECVKAYEHLLPEVPKAEPKAPKAEPKAAPMVSIGDGMLPGSYVYYHGTNGRLRYHEVLLDGRHVDRYAKLVQA